jgi:hypothetical protein
VKGTGEVPPPGSGDPLEPGEFFLGYPDEDSPSPPLPQPEILVRNGSYLAYRQLQEHVGRFRDFLRQHGKTPEEATFYGWPFLYKVCVYFRKFNKADLSGKQRKGYYSL